MSRKNVEEKESHTPLLQSVNVNRAEGEHVSEEKEIQNLDLLFNYYIKQVRSDNQPGLDRQELAKFLIEVIGGSAGIYYWPSADDYAKNKSAWLRYSLIIGNTTAGVLFLINATDNFLESVFQEWNVPVELIDILQVSAKKDLIRKDLKILLGSAICAIPFAIAAYLFPLPGCEENCLGIAVTHSWLANTILHAISWELILTPAFWYYRLPFLPIEKLLAKYKESKLSPTQKQIHRIDQQIELIYGKYRNKLVIFYTNAVNKIINDRVNAQIDQSSPERISKEFIGNMGSIEEVAVLAHGNGSLPSLSPPQQLSTFSRYCKGFHRFLLNGGASFIGGLFMVIGSVGWEANPLYLGSDTLELNTGEAIAFGILPAYSMTVLSAFYGSIFLDRVYRFLTTSWDQPRDKLPIEAKLYSKSFALFTLIIGYLSFFSYATAEALINKIFGAEIWDALRPHLQRNAYPALQMLSFIALMDLFTLYTRKLTATFGSGDNKILAQLQIQCSCIVRRLNQVKGGQLILRLEKLTEDFRTKHLDIDPQEFKQDLEMLRKLDDEKSQLTNTQLIEPQSSHRNSRSWCRFLCPTSSEETASITEDIDKTANYSALQ